MRLLLAAALAVVGSSQLFAADPAAGGVSGFVAQPDCSSLAAGTVPYSKDGLVGETPANKLGKDEPQQKWRLLFDGESLTDWAGFQRPSIPEAWHVKDGALTLPKSASAEPGSERGDIRTVDTFNDFELRLQWAVATGGNSGIFFFVREGVEDRIWTVAPEMQILDDARHEDGVKTSHRAGGLYDIYAPRCNALKPPGQYNDVRLIVRKGHVEHWLNGFQVVAYELGSADYQSRLAQSKFRERKNFGTVHSGHLGLQDHGDEIRFRNIRIQEL